MMTLWLVRHGQTDWNKERRYQGHSDISLNATGKQQAKQLAERLASQRLHAIISSDLQRATQTAQIIADAHQLTLNVQTDSDLREANFGVFEGLRYQDVIEQYPNMAEAWFADPDAPPDEGEKLSTVAVRLQAFTTRILTQYTGNKNLLIVGHDGALRLLIAQLLGMPMGDYWRFNVDACSLSRINIYPGGAILIRLNDVSHLK